MWLFLSHIFFPKRNARQINELHELVLQVNPANERMLGGGGADGGNSFLVDDALYTVNLLAEKWRYLFLLLKGDALCHTLIL